MKKITFLIFILVTVIWASFLFYILDVDFSGSLHREDRMVDFSRNASRVLTYDFPHQEGLFLKIKTYGGSFVDKVSLNGNAFHLEEKGNKKLKKLYYFNIPGEYLMKGENKLLLRLREPSRFKIDVRVYNYRKKMSENFIIFFLDSHLFLRQKDFFKFALTCFVFFIVFMVLRVFLRKIFSFCDKAVYQKILVIFLVPTLFLTFAYFLLLHFGYRIAMTQTFLFSVYGAWFFIYTLGSLLRFLIALNIPQIQESRESFWQSWKKRKYVEALRSVFLPQAGQKEKRSSREYEFFSAKWKKRIEALLSWYDCCDASEKSIVFFLFFILLSSVFLMMGAEEASEFFANICFLLLFFAAIGKCLKLFREGKGR